MTTQFSKILEHIEKKRTNMFETNPFFKTIADNNLSYEKRMLFIPYMVFFTCAAPDVVTLVMQSKREKHQLSAVENKINAYVNEDNFHYNYYLKDLESLGYTHEKFGSVSGVIRHVFSEESIPARKLVYALSYYSRQHFHPLVRLTLCELLEAGLFDLFVTIYKKIIKQESSPFAGLEYFGDTHVNLEMHHTVTSWFSGNESDVASIDIPDHTLPFLIQVVEEIMQHFNDMYLAFHEIIMKGNTICPAKYDIQTHPPIDQITNNVISHHKKSLLADRLHAMKHHKVFHLIDSREKLGTFMQWHVFAVWDFMSLIKRLQNDLTGTALPWMPPENPEAARLINEIVLGEETDVLPDGSHISHFELYRLAMKNIDISTAWIDAFIHQLRSGDSPQLALDNLAIPKPVKEFVKATLSTVNKGDTLDVLGSFFYGREDAIPEMFQHLLNTWQIKPEKADVFVYYLQRHIALDAEEHGPAMQKIIDQITKNDPHQMDRILDAALEAIQNRIILWDALAEHLKAMNTPLLEACA